MNTRTMLFHHGSTLKHYPIKIWVNVSFDENLANRIREYLSGIPNVEEKKMMGGLTFMVNDKMCVGIFKDELMCRIDPAQHETAIGKPACRTMDFTKRPMI